MNEARKDDPDTAEDTREGPSEEYAVDDEDAGAAGDELSELRQQADAYKANWQRAAADLQNYKRRTEQERAEQAGLQKATLIINVLPIFDDLDRAAESVDARLAGLGWVQGVLNIHRKFAQLLESMEVRAVNPEGDQFDPNLHEAVGQQPGDENTVVAVLQKGYMLGDRVLRPAMVIVGDGSSSEGGDAPADHHNA